MVCKWIGNTPRIAQQHYLQVTDEHYAQATGEAGPGEAQNPAQPTAATPCRASRSTEEVAICGENEVPRDLTNT